MLSLPPPHLEFSMLESWHNLDSSINTPIICPKSAWQAACTWKPRVCHAPPDRERSHTLRSMGSWPPFGATTATYCNLPPTNLGTSLGGAADVQGRGAGSSLSVRDRVSFSTGKDGELKPEAHGRRACSESTERERVAFSTCKDEELTTGVQGRRACSAVRAQERCSAVRARA